MDAPDFGYPPHSSGHDQPFGHDADAGSPVASDASAAETRDLDRVRAILFGDAQQQIHDRIDALGERLSEDVAALRETMREQSEAFQSALDEEARQRGEERDQQSARARELADHLDTSRAQLEQRADDLERSLRSLIEETVSRATETLTQRLRHTEKDLRSAKTDRSLLADLLGQVASGLREEDTEEHSATPSSALATSGSVTVSVEPDPERDVQPTPPEDEHRSW